MLFSKKLLGDLFFPNKDQLEFSNKKFPDQSDYKIEVPTINSFETLRKIIFSNNSFFIIGPFLQFRIGFEFFQTD
jgi:hypothetical protein